MIKYLIFQRLMVIFSVLNVDAAKEDENGEIKISFHEK
jgi:hypothetical protein